MKKEIELMTISTTKTVCEFAVEVPGATRIFEKLGIDYSCVVGIEWGIS
jgi:iron-sulfur cluster repair protein YtfE (RIC family)